MKDRGFQLFETAVAISLLLTLAGWGALGTQRFLDEHRLHAAGLSLVSAEAVARSMAITRNTDIRVATRSPSREFGLTGRHSEPSSWKSLPSGVRFASVPGRSVTFHGRGTAAPAGTFRITNEAGTLRIVIAVSGRVRWSRE